LVSQIEAGLLDTPETRLILENALLPMLAQNIDTVVLGCTHYPFVIPLIQDIVTDAVRVIDPAPAIARQASRLLDLQPFSQIPASSGDLLAAGPNGIQIFTSGDPVAFSGLLPKLINLNLPVKKVCWQDMVLQFC
jgi:glutamate racemase